MMGNNKCVVLVLLALLLAVAKALPVHGDHMVVSDDEDIDMFVGRTDGKLSSVETHRRLGWHLDRIDQRKASLDGKYCPQFNGSGIDIYIFATGIDYDHREFGGRAFRNGGYDALNLFGFNNHASTLDHEVDDCNGLGTHIASVASGSTVGVAQDSNVYSVKTSDCSGRELYLSIYFGIVHVIKRAAETGRRSVITIPTLEPRTAFLNSIIARAINQGIVIVTSIGEEDRNSCEYAPSGSPHIISVGATGEDGDKLMEKSNYGECVTLFAPGQDVTGASVRCQGSSDSQGCYHLSSGSAVASGVVAGAVAMILQQYPHYTPAEVKSMLIDQSTKDAIDMSSLTVERSKVTPNRLLYVQNEGCYYTDQEFSGSGSSD